MSTHLLSRKKCLEESLHLSLSMDVASDTMQPTIPKISMSKVDNVWCNTMSIKSIEDLFIITIYYTVLFIYRKHIDIKHSLFNISHPVIQPCIDVIN